MYGLWLDHLWTICTRLLAIMTYKLFKSSSYRFMGLYKVLWMKDWTNLIKKACEKYYSCYAIPCGNFNDLLIYQVQVSAIEIRTSSHNLFYLFVKVNIIIIRYRNSLYIMLQWKIFAKELVLVRRVWPYFKSIIKKIKMQRKVCTDEYICRWITRSFQMFVRFLKP